MPETTETQQVPNTPPLEVKAPNTEDRQAVYEKLYGSEKKEATPPPQQTVTSTASAAPDQAALIQSLLAEVQSLKSQITQPPVITTATIEPEKTWFSKLQEGDVPGAEQTLIDKVANDASGKITNAAVAQALEVFSANQEINRFNDTVRADNPDLLDVEPLIGLQAEQLFNQGLKDVKNTKQYTELYKKSVNTAVDSIRTILQRTRAAAKEEERTTRKEVLGSYTVPSNRPQPTANGETQQKQPVDNQLPDNSPESYMEMRRNQRNDNSLPPDVRRSLYARQ